MRRSELKLELEMKMRLERGMIEHQKRGLIEGYM